MSEAAAIRRQLQIKLGAVNRLYKEYNGYIQGKEDLTRKLHEREADGPEKHVGEEDDLDNKEWHIKNTKNMIVEEEKMIVDTTERLKNYTQDLRDLLTKAEKYPDLTEDYIKAKETLEAINV